MSNYINSNNIEVFPSGFRTSDSNSKLTTEKNLTELRLLSQNAANRDRWIEDPEDANYYIVFIKGYKFRFLKSDVPQGCTYASIRLREVGETLVLDNYTREGNSPDYNLDGTNGFTGLYFSEEAPSNLTNNVYSVKKDSNLVLDSSEIRNTTNHPITTQFNTEKIISTNAEITNATITNAEITNLTNTKINNVNITSSDSGDSNTNLHITAYHSDYIEETEGKYLSSIKLGSDGYIGKIDVNGSFQLEGNLNVQAVNSTINISGNGNIELGGAGSTGKLKIIANEELNISKDNNKHILEISTKNENTSKSTLKIAPNTTFTIPGDNTTSTPKALVQNNSTNEWLQVAKTNTKNTIVQRDGTDIKADSFNSVEIHKVLGEEEYKNGSLRLKLADNTGIRVGKQIQVIASKDSNNITKFTIDSNDDQTADMAIEQTTQDNSSVVLSNSTKKITLPVDINVENNDPYIWVQEKDASTNIIKNKWVSYATRNSYGLLSAEDKTDLDLNTTNRHSHTNKNILDNTTASFTTALETKLNGIEQSANRYTLPTATSIILGGVKSATTGRTQGRDYKVEVNTDGTMKVNVPWENTTYESKNAVNGGSDISLVTTGEKYTWNTKAESNHNHDSVYLKLTGGTVNGDITCTGNITANTFNATSDRRLKENIESFNTHKSILDLDVKKFDFINGAKNQIGCIAQDLKEICPEIVSENKEGYLSIQENKLVYLLLNEVKKLKEEIESLKKEK